MKDLSIYGCDLFLKGADLHSRTVSLATDQGRGNVTLCVLILKFEYIGLRGD